jgi:hypothetical protein
MEADDDIGLTGTEAYTIVFNSIPDIPPAEMPDFACKVICQGVIPLDKVCFKDLKDFNGASAQLHACGIPTVIIMSCCMQLPVLICGRFLIFLIHPHSLVTFQSARTTQGYWPTFSLAVCYLLT